MSYKLAERIFNWGENWNVSDASFTAGSHYLGYGGAIDFYNDLNKAHAVSMNVTRAEFINNSANVGGAVDVYYGTMDVTSAVFSGNSAGQWGGAFYTEGGIITMSNVTFNANSAASAIGGGVMVGSNATLSLSRGSFSNNSAQFGGGLYNAYGIVGAAAPNVVIENTAFTSNCAETGGGIDNYVGSMALSDLTLSGNSALYGGGLYNNFENMQQDTVNLTFSNGLVQNNSARQGGGIKNESGAVLLDGTITYSGNSANNGGALHNQEGYVTLGGIQVFSANSAAVAGGAILNSAAVLSGSAEFSGNSAQWGGALYNDNGSAVLNDAAFSSNSAGNAGGALYLLNGGSMTLTKPAFENNSASYGGAVYNGGGAADIYDCLFAENTAVQGGAVQNAAGELYISNGVFSGNSANSGGAVWNDAALDLLGSNDFNANSAHWGGAVFNSSTLNLSSGVTFSRNFAEQAGGAVLNQGTMVISDGQYSNNSAGVNGGAIYNVRNMTISDTTINANRALSEGGALFNGAAAELVLNDVEISGNSARWGGALTNSGTAELTNVQFTNNDADQTAGAINNSGKMSLSNVTFSGNSAQWGGAVYNQTGATLTVNGLKLQKSSDTIFNYGDIVFSGSNKLGAMLFNDGSVTLDISQASVGNTAVIDDLDKITGSGTVYISIADVQYDGDYVIAGNADFLQNITLISADSGQILGDFSFFDRKIKVGDAIYTLKFDDDALLLNIFGVTTTDVFKPVLNSGLTAELSGRDVSFTWDAATDDREVAGYKIKIGDSIYEQSQGTAFNLTNLDYGIYACSYQACDSSGNTSNWSDEIYISVLPQAPVLEISNTTPTNQNVTITLSCVYSDVEYQYSYDGINFFNTDNSFTVTENLTVYFRTTAAGLFSETVSCKISNIDREPGVIVLSADNLSTPMEEVRVKISYPEDAVQKLYSTDGVNWKNYTSEIVLRDNTPLYAQSRDAAGNIVNSELTVGNIVHYAADRNSWQPASHFHINGNQTLANISVSNQYQTAAAGIYLESGNLILNNVALLNNRSQEVAAGLMAARGSVTGQNLYISGNTAAWGGGIFLSNADLQLSSACIYGNGGNQTGGGIQHEKGTFNGSSLIFSGNSASVNGGAVFSLQAQMVFSNATFLNNSAYRDNDAGANGGGGALYNENGKITLNNTYLYENTASWGGAVNNQEHGQLIISGGRLVSNATYLWGRGGAVNNFGTATIQQTEFSGNSGHWGGAFYTGIDEYGDGRDYSLATLNGVSFLNNSATDEGGAVETTGEIFMTDMIFSGNSAQWGGAVAADGGKVDIVNAQFIRNSGSFTGTGGALWIKEGGTMYVTSAVFSENYAGYGAAIQIEKGTLHLDSAVFSGNKATKNAAIFNTANGTMYLSNIQLETFDDTIYNEGKITFSGENSLGALVNNYGSITLDLSKNVSGGDALISNWWMINNFGSVSITINNTKGEGIYKLADNMQFYDLYNISFSVGNNELTSSITEGETYSTSEFSYTFKQQGNSVYLKISGPDCTNGLNWQAVDSAGHYVIKISGNDQFSSCLNIESDTNSIDTFALPSGSWYWQAETTDNVPVGSDTLISQYDTDKSWVIESEANGIRDVFFTRAKGNWASGYCAQHQGFSSGQSIIEVAVLSGRNKIIDIYQGSEDANVLLLSDDACGDALFLDDIFSDRGNQARLANIDKICAGYGNDIIDLTSRQFEFNGGGIWINGGDGDDTIWANDGPNTLFGDAGKDRIIGGEANDVIIGGSGNDFLHGGGGNDIFAFGGNWGNDTVEQLKGETVTLWFESDTGFWNEETRTYSCGTNSVTVDGQINVILKFGNDGSEEYNELVSLNAFSDAVSAKIFDDKDTGFLA